MVPSTSGSSALSNARGQELRRAGRGAEHDEVGAGVGADQQLAAEPSQPRRAGGGLHRCGGTSVAALAGHGVDERARGAAHLDGVQLDQVSRQRRLRDLDALLGEQCRELALRPDLVVAHAARRSGGGGRSWCAGRRVASVMSASSSAVASARNVSTAFCACRRFSASSQTTLCGPSMTSGCDLLAAVGRQAVHARSRPAARGRAAPG